MIFKSTMKALYNNNKQAINYPIRLNKIQDFKYVMNFMPSNNDNTILLFGSLSTHSLIDVIDQRNGE